MCIGSCIEIWMFMTIVLKMFDFYRFLTKKKIVLLRIIAYNVEEPE